MSWPSCSFIVGVLNNSALQVGAPPLFVLLFALKQIDVSRETKKRRAAKRPSRSVALRFVVPHPTFCILALLNWFAYIVFANLLRQSVENGVENLTKMS